jgi:hypothetical protein
MNTENRFSPSPADQRNQADLRHPERTVYRCFLTDLAGFTDVCRAGPDYADRQDRKKTGLFHFFSAEHLYYTPAAARCQLFFNPGPGGCMYMLAGPVYQKFRQTASRTIEPTRQLEIFADQQAIFLLHAGRNHAAIRENGRCQGTGTLAGVGAAIRRDFLGYSA